MIDGYWSLSAQYRTPTGRLGFITCYKRCSEEELEKQVIKQIKRNRRRRFAGELKIYNKTFTPYTKKELARCKRSSTH